MKTIIIVLIFFASLVSSAYAAIPKPTATMEKSVVEATSTTKITYTLPYPGILTDHPLYFLKNLRDSIMERLIADPPRKIEFYILQGDKSLNSAVFLDVKGKDAFAAQAIVRSGEHMEKAVTMAKAIKAKGTEVPGYIIEHLTNSFLKHKEVLAELMGSASETQKSNLTKAVALVGKLQEEVTKLGD